MINFYDNNTRLSKITQTCVRHRPFNKACTRNESSQKNTSAPQHQEAAGGNIVIFSAAPIGRCPYGMEGSIFRELLAYVFMHIFTPFEKLLF